MLNTNIAVHAMEGRDDVLDRMVEYEGNILPSALSLAERQRGVYKHAAQASLRRARMDELLRTIPVLPFDATSAEAYGQINALCGWAKGRDFDRMIAAHAIVSGSVLVTNNVADFQDIPGLHWENWIV